MLWWTKNKKNSDEEDDKDVKKGSKKRRKKSSRKETSKSALKNERESMKRMEDKLMNEALGSGYILRQESSSRKKIVFLFIL